MWKILNPEDFVTAPWKNGGGITHEIARKDGMAGLVWRLSIAEVASDGPFSSFDGLTRILTVIEGAGIDLHSPLGDRRVLPGVPFRFSGGLPVRGALVEGAIRDLNVIFDAGQVEAGVEPVSGPADLAAGAGVCAVLALAGAVEADAQPLRAGAVALGGAAMDGVEGGSTVRLGPGARALRVTLRPVAGAGL